MTNQKALTPKMNTSTISLIACKAMHTVVTLFANTFLVAYLLNIASSDTSNVLSNASRVAIYYICVYGSMIFFYSLFSIFVKRTKRVGLYRLGVFLMCGFVFLIAFLQNYITEYYFLFALFYGLANSLYYSCCNTMQSEIVSSRITKKFFAVSTVVNTIVNITVPLVLGATIEVTSFVNTAIIVFVVSFIQFILTFFIKNERATLGRLEIKQFFNIIKDPKYKIIKSVYVSIFFQGFRNMLPSVITTLTVMTFNSNISLGILTSIFSAVSIVTLLIYTKFGNKKNTWIILLCGILPALSIIGLLINISKETLIIYNLTSSICLVVIDLMCSIHRIGLTRELSLYNYVMENQAVCEIILNFSRVCAFSSFLAVSLINDITVFKIFLCFSIMIIPLYSWLLYRIQNKINNIDHSLYSIHSPSETTVSNNEDSYVDLNAAINAISGNADFTDNAPLISFPFYDPNFISETATIEDDEFNIIDK